MLRYGFVLAVLVLASLPPSRAAARGLVVNEATGRAQYLVYELPDDEGRADAVGYIKGIHDKFFSKLEIVDATNLDDSALRDRLKGDFVLYTTAGEKSRIFRAATEPLHISIDGGTLSWQGVTAPVSDLRLILVGKNPFGDGHCAVYAGGSNRLVAGVNNRFHGPSSYYIFSDDKLLKEGFYSEKYAVVSDRISQAEAVEDTKQFFSTLQRVHPDLLANVSIEDYIKLKKQTLDDIDKKLDREGKIAIGDLAYSLYYAGAFFRDGHTSVHWQSRPNEHTSQARRFPPFLLECDNGRFVIAGSADASMQGQEIVAVNGEPIRQFLAPILDRCSGETLAFKAVRFTSNQLFWYSFTGLCGSAESLTLRLRDARGKEGERSAATVGLAEFRKLISGGRDNKREQLRRQGAQVSFLDSNKIAYLSYPAFNLSDDEKKKIDTAFQQVKAKGSRELIIDIRGNGGGNSAMGDFIFSYLYAGKFRAFSKARARLSSDILAAAGRNMEIPEDADIDGLVVDMPIKETAVPKPRAFFSGRVFLLTDNGTFSSATDFAAMFRDYGVGTILGYETGGVPSCFGDVYSFELKNSGIPCGVSWKQFFGPKPRPGDDRHGVLPNIAVNSDLLRPYQREDDPVLALALDQAKKTRRNAGGTTSRALAGK